MLLTLQMVVSIDEYMLITSSIWHKQWKQAMGFLLMTCYGCTLFVFLLMLDLAPPTALECVDKLNKIVIIT